MIAEGTGRGLVHNHLEEQSTLGSADQVSQADCTVRRAAVNAGQAERHPMVMKI
jgi:hypothetical protein